MGYTFIKTDNLTKITHTDGREWILMESPTVYSDQDFYYIESDNLHITFRSFEIDYIGGITPYNTEDALIAQLNAILPAKNYVGSADSDDATATNQTSEIGLLTTIASMLTTINNTRAPIDTDGQSMIVSNFPSTQPISGSVSVNNLPSSQAVTVTSGSLSVSNLPATQAISGSVSVNNLPATQPISGTVSIGNFPSSQSVTVSNLPSTQSVSGNLTISNLPSTSLITDAFANPTVQMVSADVLNYNGSSWDRHRNNYGETVISSVTTNSGGSSPTMTNYNARGAIFFVNITAATGTLPTLTMQVQALDPTSGVWANITGALTTVLASVGMTTLTIGNGITLIANAQVNVNLPRTYRVSYTIGGISPSFTFSVGVQYTS